MAAEVMEKDLPEVCAEKRRKLYDVIDENQKGVAAKNTKHISSGKYQSLMEDAVYPNNFEKQCVGCTDSIIHDSTIASIVVDDLHTSQFLQIIRHWWNVVNVKSRNKDRAKRSGDAILRIALAFNISDNFLTGLTVRRVKTKTCHHLSHLERHHP
ncbi:hypothetical protein DMENIID0001_144710 [Sergentomyia squamirostris]